jgi:hypothetical protein
MVANMAAQEKPMPDDRRDLWNRHKALDEHSRRVLESVINDQKFMQATREGVEASLRGEKGVPLREVLEDLRRREAGNDV